MIISEDQFLLAEIKFISMIISEDQFLLAEIKFILTDLSRVSDQLTY